MNKVSSPEFDLKTMFSDCASKWQHSQKEISRLATAIRQDLSTVLTPAQVETLDLRQKVFGDAVQNLANQARSPELVIATTGTTSSGKSTLANFLIGEEILPSAVQEMSAGVVTVRHHEKRHTLKIPSTRGATWETGEWDDLPADVLRKKLAETMEAFRQAEKNDATIEAVRFEIDWPLRLAKQAAKFGLPKDTRVTIVDLPGLNALMDERNGAVIKENIKQALCLVTYNSEETDKKKQDELLNQIIAQVMELRQDSKSLSRMLFLLNRVDAFDRDVNPELSLGKFKDFVTSQLQSRLLKSLPEEKSVIKAIEPAMISSMPAYLGIRSEALENTRDRQTEIFDKIEERFQSIFPKRYWKDLPRNMSDLSEDQKRHLIDDTLRYSRAYDFENSLGKHIAENLPDIVLAGPVAEVNGAAGELIYALDEVLKSHETRTEADVNGLKQRLSSIEEELNKKSDEVFVFLSQISEKANAIKSTSRSEAEIRDVYDLLSKFEEKFKCIGLMDPVENFGNNVFEISTGVIQRYCEGFLSGQTPSHPPLLLNLPDISKLDEALIELKNSPYGKNFLTGGEYKGDDAKAVENALTNFVEIISSIVNHAVIRASDYFGKSVDICFEKCADLMISDLKEVGEKALRQDLKDFPGLEVLFHGKIVLPKFNLDKIDFLLCAEKITKTETHEHQFIRQERHWYTLWLYPHEETRIVKKPIEVEFLKIRSFRNLFSTMLRSGDTMPFWASLRDYITNAMASLEQHQINKIKHVVTGYQQAIDQSVVNVTQQTEQTKNLIHNHVKALSSLRVEITSLS